MVNEYLKNLIKAGFKVYLIDIDNEVKIKEKPSIEAEPVEGKKKEKTRINWKTIEKIKKLKVEGWSSQEVAEDLKIAIELVNKHWV